MRGSGKKSVYGVNFVAFLLVGLAAVLLFRTAPMVLKPNQNPVGAILPSENNAVEVKANPEFNLEPVALKNKILTPEEIEKLAEEWRATTLTGLVDTSISPQLNTPSVRPSQGCQVNRILDRLAERSVTDETEIFEALKMELTNTDCSPCLTKQKMIARLYESAQKKFNWTETEDVTAQETALIENGLLPKGVSLFSDRTCVFHRDYGYAPDFLASPSPLFARQNTAIGGVNQANLSVLGSIYEMSLSPSF